MNAIKIRENEVLYSYGEATRQHLQSMVIGTVNAFRQTYSSTPFKSMIIFVKRDYPTRSGSRYIKNKWRKCVDWIDFLANLDLDDYSYNQEDKIPFQVICYLYKNYESMRITNN